MKKDFLLSIPKACNEDWRKFTPTAAGGFCGSCQKEVVDFTSWTDEQIRNYFLRRRGSTCGKFKPHQLKLYRAEKQQRGWVPSLVAFVLLLLSRPAEAQPVPRTFTEQVEKVDDRTLVGDTLAVATVVRGVVYDAYEESKIPGVHVLETGTRNQSTTDAEGKFEMTILGGGDSVRLQFSFIGYETKELVLPRRSVHETEIRLSLDVSVLGGIAVGGVVALKWYSPRRWWWKVRALFR